MSDNDQYGEGENYFSVFKIGGVKANSYTAKIVGQPNAGVKSEIVRRPDGSIVYDSITGEPVVKLTPQLAYTDGSDTLANNGFTVSIQSVINGSTVAFKAFISAYNESYNSNWNSEDVYGRTDPIYMFKNTTRSITMGLLVPAATEGEAFENMIKVQKLVQKLYPAYSDVQGAQTIAQSPLVRMKAINLTQKYTAGADEMQGLASSSGQGNSIFNMKPNTGDGLLGFIRNLSINHNLDNPDVGVFEVRPGVILPKLIELQIEFSAIHEATVKQTAESNNNGFPYSIDASNFSGKTKEQIVCT